MTQENTSSPQDAQLQTEQVTAAPVARGELKPIDSSSRIDTMDILRGFALIGIALMNVEWFNRSIMELGRFDFNLTGADWTAGWFIRLFVEGKFYKLFSILFGMGFAVMLIRAQEVGRPFYGWFSRRMIFLFLFGMAHMIFLWTGDILHDYAVGGLVLLLWIWAINKFKRLAFLQQSKWFLRIGLGMMALPMVIALIAGMYFGTSRTQDVMLKDNEERIEVRARAEEIKKDPELSAKLIAEDKAKKDSKEPEPEVNMDEMSDEEQIQYRAERRFINRYNNEQDKAKEKEAFTQPSWWVATQYRAGESIEYLQFTPVMAFFISFPMFMVGYWFVASGVMRRPQEHVGLFKSMMWVGLGAGLLMNLSALLLMANPVYKFAVEVGGVAEAQFMFGQYFMTAGYIGAFCLMCLTVRGKKWLGWLAPMGRMALTNYIMHSVILTSIFYGSIGGMFGQIPRIEQVGIIALIIVFQAIFSAIWLKFFRFGPLEWLWRSLTYLKIQPMKVEDKSQVEQKTATV